MAIDDDLSQPIFDGDTPRTQREIMALRVCGLRKCEAGYLTGKVCGALLIGLRDMSRHMAAYGPRGKRGPPNGRAV